ncbi:MAG: substrate-binding domain-containing protein [Lentisphaerae bacterium]|nr:substrate-binding domain-containing protein [Lentisphaerota bacterium]
MNKARQTRQAADAEPQYLRIRREIRGRIAGGVLRPGDRLPPTLALCRQWGARPCTVQAALAPLVREGLLQRRPRQGTRVAAPSGQALRRVALYCTESIFREESTGFERALYGALVSRLAERHAVLDAWVDGRRAARRGQAWSDLVEAAQARRVDAVIMLDPQREQFRWMGRLPVPVSCMASQAGPNVVSVDYAAVFVDGVRYLKAAGCRRVGTISGFTRQRRAGGGSTRIEQEALAALRRAAAAQGVELRDAAMRAPPGPLASPAAHQQFGYEAMHALWSGRTRPDGLIVADDVMLAGVVAALLERRVRLPGELQVVGYKNSAIPVFAPLPLAFVEVSTSEIAEALIDQLRRQLQGQPVQRRLIGPRLLPAPRAGAAARGGARRMRGQRLNRSE